MIDNYFRTAWRNLSRNRYYTAINVAGMGISIAACVLIGLFVFNELSFDNKVRDQRIYRVNEYIHYDGTAPQLSAAIGPPIAPFLKNNHNEIENFTRVLPATPSIFTEITLQYEDIKIKPEQFVCTDTSFANMFDVEILEGNKSDFVRSQNSIVLTERIARKLFGSSSALNKKLVLYTSDSTSLNLVVSNVIKDLPVTSHLHQIEGLLPVPKEFEEGFLGTNYGVLLGPAYFKLAPRANVKQLQEKLTSTLHAKNKFIDVRLQPLEKVHTGSMDINYDFFNYQKMDGKYINIFVIVAIAIFVIACFNFINLSIAISGYRGKEIAIKKIVGAGKTQIILQVFAEVFLLVLLAILFAVLLAAIALPNINVVFDRALPLSRLHHPVAIGAYIAILLLTTLLAGFYPAWTIASSKVNHVLRTKVLFTNSRTTLRNVLVTGQFAIAVVFIISLLVFRKQLNLLQDKNLGYSYSQVIKIPLDVSESSKLSSIRAELLKTKGVRDVANGFMELGGNGSIFGVDYVAADGEKKQVSVNFENASSNYLPFFGMKIIAGRNFTLEGSASEYIINESFARQIGYSDPIGKPINLSSWPSGTIVGVVQDYNYSSLRTKVEPLILASFNEVPSWHKQLYVKLSTADLATSLKEIEASWKRVSGESSLNYQFLDEHFREVYRTEQQMAVIVGIIGGLSLLVACLGLFGLISFAIARRTKEISIRKILGASVGDIAAKLSGEFILLVLVAFLIASPIASYLMNHWLQDFAYRIHIEWWMFLVAAVMVVVIAFVTISFQAINAAVANPVKNLRTE